ncbi:DNA replication complex GINS protein PSF1 [Choanephora cucurbitarum]|uniref:DNA replication complex GINS protein PSF1 n=1 Tax=Choanephora cucurbitarum TaxID=101091 RepID=A0A1C7NDI7_9FUNG|nr:DNA replication complex GINS protein PSF1 [Choanephora cucurbitarum]
MAALGESAYKLAKEAKRTADLFISNYNDDLVQSICREIRLLNNKAIETVNAIKQDNSGDALQNPSTMTQVMLYHLAVKRNKRVLFAYHRQRINKLKDILWNVGLQSKYRREILTSLGPTEKSFLDEYGDIVNAYKQGFAEVDLGGMNGPGLDPPVDLFIEVRVLRDAGEINTEYGTLNLSKGNQFYVRRTDVESLIKAGYLVHV